MVGKRTGLARHITELTDPSPKDFDPEESANAESTDEGSNSQDSEDDLLGTEHYLEVGKSNLRNQDEIPLGPKYAGARVSREDLQSSINENSGSDYEDAGELQGVNNFVDLEAPNMEVDDEDEDINSDEAFGESDTEKFKDFSFPGSSTTSKMDVIKRRKTTADSMEDSGSEQANQVSSLDNSFSDSEESLNRNFEELDKEEDEANEDDDSQNDGRQNGNRISETESEMDEDNDEDQDEESIVSATDDNDTAVYKDPQRAEVRRIMNEEQKTVVATISQAARADAEKGKAVKKQRKMFDSLLNVRIRLQKSLVAINSMATVDDKNDIKPLPYQAAEEAAIKLLDTLDALRQALGQANSSQITGEKRKHSIQLDTPSSAIWDRIQGLESAAVSSRQSTLEKWSSRVRDSTAQPISRKLNRSTQHTITDILKDHLSNSERLVKKTKMPRSCAPVQARMKVTEDPNIYDDADFYQLLLKELVDQRMVDSTNISASLDAGGRPLAQWMAVKEAKTKKNVDTKASKGRKMRYTVHEKLQNFMAPEDRGTWEPEAIERFFGTLLGQTMSLEEDGDGSEIEMEGAPLAEEALILFRS